MVVSNCIHITKATGAQAALSEGGLSFTQLSWLLGGKLAAARACFLSSVRSSNSHPDLLVITTTTPLFQITPVLNTGLSLSEPLQLYKGYNAI